MHRTATFVDIKIDSYGISRSNENPIVFDADPKSMKILSQQMIKLWNGGNQFVKRVDQKKLPDCTSQTWKSKIIA